MSKIFFACSMRGGCEKVKQDDLREIAFILKSLGHTLISEHQTDNDFFNQESAFSATEIFQRDYCWIMECDYIIAEITNPSLGVGGEISDASALEKPVLCLYKKKEEKSISAYIRGKANSIFTPTIKSESYCDLDELKSKTENFIKRNPVKRNIIKVAAAMINQNKELLIVRKKHSKIYIHPGGKIDGKETHFETLQRELMEELKVDLIESKYFKSYFSPSAAHDPNCTLAFHLYIAKWGGKLKPSSEIYKAEWLKKGDIESKKYELAILFSQIIPDLRKAGLIDI
ncbi:MAG: NUDIX domain-containing protein [Candidatus Aenigmarchaeota archaeon]|nr:NUDIX domain-containing protein [Candidatus Aenigmarchaeota archaeon]